MAMIEHVRKGIWAAVVLAALWSSAILVMAATVPMLHSVRERTNRHGLTTVTETSKTLVEAEGTRILAILAVPLVVSIVVAIALLWPRTGWLAHGVGWFFTGVLGLLTLLAILTIGIAIVPVTMLLVTACGLDLARREATPR